MVRHRCFPTNDRTRGYWQRRPDHSGCVQGSLVRVRERVRVCSAVFVLIPCQSHCASEHVFQLDHYLNGYLLPGDDDALPARFFRQVYNRTESRPLYAREWKEVMAMARRTLTVRHETRMEVEFGMRKMA